MARKKGGRKDPARVKAGKKAWARMSASAKAKVVARLAPFRKHKGTSRSSGSNPTRSHASHGGGSTAKNKPKPRLAIYGGLVGSAVVATGVGGGGAVVPADVSVERNVAAVARDAQFLATHGDAVVKAATPALIGVGLSWAADRLGVNRMLARARAPFRI